SVNQIDLDSLRGSVLNCLKFLGLDNTIKSFQSEFPLKEFDKNVVSKSKMMQKNLDVSKDNVSHTLSKNFNEDDANMGCETHVQQMKKLRLSQNRLYREMKYYRQQLE
ncbi:MAG: hypothetical protein MHPSP_001720, partial [Paramarteilia canceri]